MYRLYKECCVFIVVNIAKLERYIEKSNCLPATVSAYVCEFVFMRRVNGLNQNQTASHSQSKRSNVCDSDKCATYELHSITKSEDGNNVIYDCMLCWLCIAYMIVLLLFVLFSVSVFGGVLVLVWLLCIYVSR